MKVTNGFGRVLYHGPVADYIFCQIEFDSDWMNQSLRTITVPNVTELDRKEFLKKDKKLGIFERRDI